MKVKSNKCKHGFNEECEYCIEFGTTFYVPDTLKNKIEKIDINC